MSAPAVPFPKLVRVKHVQSRTGLSKSTIYTYMKQGLFPASVSLGPRTVGWVEHDVARWIRERVRASREMSK